MLLLGVTFISFVAGFITGIFFFANAIEKDSYRADKHPKSYLDSWSLISIDKCPEDRFYALLKVETPCGVRTFKGNGNIWMDLERFRRCTTEEECVLTEFLENRGLHG